MEHRCYQCDAAVEDGIPFCRQCKAPQIRVMTVERPSAGESNVAAIDLAPYPPLRQNVRPEWVQALPAAFLGLLISTLLSAVLRGALGIGLLAAGFLSVFFFRRRNPYTPITLKLGAKLGARCGVLGFAITAIATAAATAILRSGGEIHDLMMKAVQQYVSRNPDPQMQQVLDFYASRQGFILMLVLGSIMMFLLFLAVSSIGGMLGASLLKRKDST